MLSAVPGATEAITAYFNKPSIELCNELIDIVEASLKPMEDGDEVNITSKFADGLYVRQAIALKGTMVVTHEHKMTSPFFLMRGKVALFSHNEGSKVVDATEFPVHGITEKSTRRLLLVLEDCVWITVHPNPENFTDVPSIVKEITVGRDNKYLPEKT